MPEQVITDGSVTSATSAERRPVFLVFEGGGAKGFAHLGALHAVEQAKYFKPIGYAGTSAGAMVATLAAVGYKAQELFNLEAGATAARAVEAGKPAEDRPPVSPFLKRLNFADATALFGRGGWAAIRLLLGVRRHAGPALFLPLVLIPLGLGWSALAGGQLPAILATISLLWFLLLAALVVSGLAAQTVIRDAYDEALRTAPLLAEIAANRKEQAVKDGKTWDRAKRDWRVTFRDLNEAGICLKICAANLSLRRLEVFCFEKSRHVAVSDAVCASICFPGAFAPWPIARPDRRGRTSDTPPEWHLDGGLVSNLPAWCLDEERRINPDVLTLAWAIAGSAAEVPGRWNWPQAMIQTALFGGEALSTRGAGPIEVLRLDCDLAVFDFDITSARAYEVVEGARKAAVERLRFQVTAQPDKVRAVAAALRDRTVQALGLNLADNEVRACFAVAEDHLAGGLLEAPLDLAVVKTLTLRYGAGFEGCPDAGLVVPVHGSVVGLALREQQPILRFLGPLDLPPALLARLRPGLAWILALPVRLPPLNPNQAREPVPAVLAIDCIRPVPPEERDRFARAIANLISAELIPILRRLEE